MNDKFMLEIHLRHPGLTYSARGSFTKNTKNKERMQKFEKSMRFLFIFIRTNRKHGMFQDNMAYGNFALEQLLIKDLILPKIQMDLECVGYQCRLRSMVYKFFDEKSFGGAINSEIISNQHLAENYISH